MTSPDEVLAGETPPRAEIVAIEIINCMCGPVRCRWCRGTVGSPHRPLPAACPKCHAATAPPLNAKEATDGR